MALQNSVLAEYKKIYPKKTLKEISVDTGIQVTRVFRLFNGSEMKLAEYEKFKLAIKKSEQESYTEEFQQTLEVFLGLVGPKDIFEIIRLMKRKIKLGQMKQYFN